jgi:general secretion pathway protein D
VIRYRAIWVVFGLMAALMSSASIAQTPTPTPTPTFEAGDDLVNIDSKDMELSVLIEIIAKMTGRNFIYDDKVRGSVTIVSPSKISVEQAYAVFESVLKVKGFTAVKGPGGVYKVIPIRDAKESNLETIMDQRPSRNRDVFVTRLIPLQNIDAQGITNTVKTLVSKDASMVAYAPTNTIIITDTAANIQRLLRILEAIDIETHKEELAVIKIKYADAATLGQQISEIYDAEVSAAPTSSSSGSSSMAAASASRSRACSSRQASTESPRPSSSSNRALVRVSRRRASQKLCQLCSWIPSLTAAFCSS